ncbi:MAG: glycosyltransferase, partial [Chloroflexi bacterium]|nr:glycosyltransferase [Chloroflexota bacterium]
MAAQEGRPEGPMGVCFLTHTFPRLEGDALGSFLLNLGMGLQAQGVRVIVVAPHGPGLKESAEIGGLPVHRFRYAPERLERLAYRGNMHELVAESWPNRFLFLALILAFFWAALRVVTRERCQLIHAHWWVPGGLVAMAVSALTGVPYVVTSHGTDLFMVERRSLLVKELARAVFRRAKAATVVSRALQGFLSLKLGLPASGIQVLPMPVRLDLFETQATPPTDASAPRAPGRILAIGRLVKRKGLNYLIEACSILKDRGQAVELTILGEGPEASSLMSLAQRLRLGERVRFVPFVPQEALGPFYRDCDVFVLPSITVDHREREGLGLVLLEAMACGRPVIGTASGGIVDVVVDGQTGLIVPERDSQALAAAIARLLG